LIGPHKLSGYRIDGTEEKLGLTIDGTSAEDLGHRRPWRKKMGHDSVGGTGFLIAGTEIQEPLPEKPACGRVIDAERER
jgi:outer membrane protein assembly factor BamA